MITFEELYRQNDKITELSHILSNLLQDRTLCDSEVTCDLFYRYVDAVKEHLNVTDAGMYTKLLTSGDKSAANVANSFMSGSQEIKRIFASYLKKWCRAKSHKLMIKEHDKFLAETEELFQIVLDRVINETEKLYPALRRITGENVRAA
ncbi:MAG: hypothetical protein KZQ58_07810 [gamma proteobacterium symbiont of Bathyaustriella thionipta]|nr:hypothetical protein [gamma proteobacterium symbiont of Bathyaustriella thionipta]